MDLSQTAKLVYALLLDRSTLSQKRKGWTDENGRVYIVFPITELAEILDKGCTTIKSALNELDSAGLLERKRSGFSTANHLYVKVPAVVQFSDSVTIRKPTLIQSENGLTDGRKTDSVAVGKPAPGKTTIANLTESKTTEANAKTCFGRYQNVFLTEAEYAELQTDYPDRLESLIEKMSCYLAANGKTYQNDAAALRIWADRDQSRPDLPDYSCEEGESL